ncbi:DUF2069 domain-containing protein [Solimonas sp. K1W22B-7]|uniref:DUF2069 domain-containing protein n=1 Tax=Solimonas sp. K1W22B-7 TaxID=2303331 RepID=UPI000E32F77B|nr:DUF2069 domain-containing protein [Solimonas sp. K1W22B-7]AXQ28615.1 DUF2069 domain-containing protein [Solimonas sp. K1W22B-7]
MKLSPLMHALAVACHLALISGLLIFCSGRLALLFGFLLFLPLPGLLRGKERTHAWTSMLISFYCAALASNAYSSSHGRALWFVLASLAALEFAATVLYVRFRAREKIAAA